MTDETRSTPHLETEHEWSQVAQQSVDDPSEDIEDNADSLSDRCEIGDDNHSSNENEPDVYDSEEEGDPQQDDEDDEPKFYITSYSNNTVVNQRTVSAHTKLYRIFESILGDEDDSSKVEYWLGDIESERRTQTNLEPFLRKRIGKIVEKLNIEGNVLHFHIRFPDQDSGSSSDDSDEERRRMTPNSWETNKYYNNYSNSSYTNSHGSSSGFSALRNDSNYSNDDGDDMWKNRPYTSNFYSNSSSSQTNSSSYSSSYSTPKVPIPEGLVGLQNQGATCYLNSLIQALYMTPEFRRMIYLFEKPWDSLFMDLNEGNQDAKKDVILHMQLLFARMQTEGESVSTNALTTSFGWENTESFVQHDVQELNRVLCDNLEEKMKGKVKEGSPTIASLYRGTTVNLIKCVNCKNVSSREEDFYDVSLVVKGKENVYQSLNEFTEVEVLEKENAYSCEKCQSKQTAHKSMKFKSLPNILNIQLKRFEYDWDNDVRVKLNDDIKFPHYLRMEDYLVDDSIFNPKEAKNETQEDSQATQDMEKEKEKEPVIYELFAILVHSGNAGYGHYYAYLKNFADGKWYKFNDESVTFVSDKNISDSLWLGQSSSSGFSSYSSFSSYSRSTTPYMLVYRKRDDFNLQTSEKKSENEFGEQIGTISSPSPYLSSPTSSASSNAMKGKKITKKDVDENNLWPYVTTPIPKEEIPVPILAYLFEEKAEEERKRKEKEEEEKYIRITLHRNSLDLPQTQLKMLKTATMGDLRKAILESASNESNDKYYYRLRRVAQRRNKTLRKAADVYNPADDQRTLVDLGIDKKPFIYLEQQLNDPSLETEFSNTPEDHVMILINVFDKKKEIPVTVCDITLPKSFRFEQLQELLVKDYFKDVLPSQIHFVEEETREVINPFHNVKQTLGEAKLTTGDILHCEIVPEGEEFSADRGIQKYFSYKQSELEMNFEETDESHQRRIAAAKAKGEELNDKKFGKKKLSKVGVIIHQADSATKLKGIIQMELGNELVPDLHQIKILYKEKWSFDPKLMAINDDNVHSKLRNANQSINFLIEIMDEPDVYQSGDMIVKVVHESDNSPFLGKYEFKFNSNFTFGQLKKILEEKTKVEVERQMILKLTSASSFTKSGYEDIVTDDSEKIGNRTNWILHELSSPSLNVITNPKVRVLQVVQFLGYESGFQTKMKTGDALLLTFEPNASLAQVKKAISANFNIPHYYLLCAFVRTNRFPIVKKDYLTLFWKICRDRKRGSMGEDEISNSQDTQPISQEDKVLGDAEDPVKDEKDEKEDEEPQKEEKEGEPKEILSQEEEDRRIYQLMEKEKAYEDAAEIPDLEMERTITLDDLDIDQLSFVCWLDKRPDRKNKYRVANRKGQKVSSSDSEVLKIKS